MFKYKRIAVGLMVIVASLVLITWAGEQDKEEVLKPAVERLMSDKWEEVAKARDELIESRKKLIDDLIGIVRTKENVIDRQKQNNIKMVMNVLGEMRAVEAIDVLVEYVAYPEYYEGMTPVMHHTSWGTPIAIFDDMGRKYPAAGALIKIGEPCIGAVKDRLSHFRHSHEMRSCLHILVHLQNVEQVNEDLKGRLEKETDAKVKKRLGNAIRYLAKQKKRHEAGQK